MGRLMGGCGDDVAAMRVDAVSVVERRRPLGQCRENRPRRSELGDLGVDVGEVTLEQIDGVLAGRVPGRLELDE